MEEKVYAKLEKTMPIIIKKTEFKGKKFLDIRKYFKKGEKVLPTQKGISLNYEDVQALLDVLKKNIDSILEELE